MHEKIHETKIFTKCGKKKRKKLMSSRYTINICIHSLCIQYPLKVTFKNR